jgi:Fic family protein
MNQFIAGIYKQQYKYKSFLPSLLNQSYKWNDIRINLLLEEANRFLGELNAYSKLIPEVDFFVHMHILKESTTSNKIEGTLTLMDEAVLSESDISPEKYDDWQEVQNYTYAMNFAIEQLDKLPLSIRLLKETHAILLQGVRGRNKLPGEIRQSQNWIGGPSPADAFFVPPAQEDLSELLSDLEKFWHNENLELPELIKVAISHYQFETIHPFLDGNGRIGRLLITLHLISKGILSKPTLYLSDFFDKNRGSYYDALTMVRTSNDMDQWIRFFLIGVRDTAKKSKETLEKIVEIRNQAETKISHLGKRSENAQKLLKLLYSKPIINTKDIQENLKVTNQTSNQLIRDFISLGLLKESKKIKNSQLYVFAEYFNLFI